MCWTMAKRCLSTKGGTFPGAPEIEIACVLNAIPVPAYVISRMDFTVTLHGVQREEFDGFNISWSNHHEYGLDIVIHEQ